MKRWTEDAAEEEEWRNGTLGADEDYAATLGGSDEEEIDAALGLQSISIRLRRSIVEDLKLIAMIHGIGYRTLIRKALAEKVAHEKKSLLLKAAARSNLASGERNQGLHHP